MYLYANISDMYIGNIGDMYLYANISDMYICKYW